jgi:hypothetical protein
MITNPIQLYKRKLKHRIKLLTELEKTVKEYNKVFPNGLEISDIRYDHRMYLGYELNTDYISHKDSIEFNKILLNICRDNNIFYMKYKIYKDNVIECYYILTKGLGNQYKCPPEEIEYKLLSDGIKEFMRYKQNE